MAERKLRSHEWFGKADKDGFLHRSWMKNQGLPGDLFDGRPVIGICNTWSELTPCNAHFRELAEKVKRGVYEAGGMPAEFPVMSLGESNLRPTAMLFRNLVSMDVEESIRANPIDGVVLLTGCDKTTPALLMGAASCDLPTIVLSGGPMLTGRFRGQRARLRHRRVQVFRGASRRQHVAGRLRRRRIRHVAQPRPLHDHGYRVDDGEHGRSARHRDGGQRRDPGRRFPPQRARAARRPPRRGIWSAKTSAFRRFSPARRSRTRSA